MKSLFLMLVCLALGSTANAAYEPGFSFHIPENHPGKLKMTCLQAMAATYGSPVARSKSYVSRGYMGATGTPSVRVNATLKNGLECRCNAIPAPMVLKYVTGRCQ